MDREKKGRRFKVAMIGQKRIPSREGGVEVVVGELAQRLAKEGFYVEAYNRSGYHVSGKEFDDGKGKWYKGIRIITVPTFKNGKLNAIVYTFLATLRAMFGKYDVIHYHAEGPAIMLWLPKLFGIRVISTIHGLDWQRAKWGNFASFILKSGEKIAAKYADEVIVLSQNVKDYFNETYGREVRFIPNAVKRPKMVEAQDITRKFGLKKDEYLLFLARLVPEKGLHYLIEAFYKVKTDKKLVIAGGSSHSFEYIDKIKKMAAKDKRILMTDFVQGRVLEELYSNAWIFVLPSEIEGMAISLLEAMSYGNCCLVSDIKENTEVVEDKAVSFKTGDVKDLERKIVQLLESPQLVEEKKKVSQDFICGKYSWESVLEQTISLYKGK